MRGREREGERDGRGEGEENRGMKKRSTRKRKSFRGRVCVRGSLAGGCGDARRDRRVRSLGM